MKTTHKHKRLLLLSASIIALSACGGGGGGDTPTPVDPVDPPIIDPTDPSPPPTPYPDPNDPSAFPTQKDTQEGSNGNDTTSTAGVLTIGDTSYHTNFPLNDIDWMSVTLEAGTTYEFSVDNVSYNGVPKLELFSASNTTTPVAEDWGYTSFNPRIRYTAVTGGSFYLKVYDLAGGVSSYTLSSRVFSDSDNDTFSSHYDCNDTNPAIYPKAAEIAGDGVDQSCSGYDWLVSANPDSIDNTSPDNTFSSAGSLPMLNGDPWDIIHRGDVYAQTHTIHTGDIDIFKVTVPARGAYEIMNIETQGANLDTVVYLSDQTTVYDFTANGQFITYWLDNSASATPGDFYLQVKVSDGVSTAAYVIGVSDGGTDADLDGYFTRAQGTGWDCDDSNPAVNAGASELAPGDGIDSNCNGHDDS